MSPERRKAAVQANKRLRTRNGNRGEHKRAFTWLEHCIVCHPVHTDRQKAYALGRSLNSVQRHWEFATRTKRIASVQDIARTIAGNHPSSGIPWTVVHEEMTGVKPGKGVRHANGSASDTKDMSWFKGNPFTQEFKKGNNAKSKS